MQKRLTLLAIETSCDETAIAIVDVKKTKQKTEFVVLGNDLASQIALHTQYGGVFPMMAKREHAKNIIPIFTNALKQAKLYVVKSKKTENKILDKKIAKLLAREQDLFGYWQEVLPLLKKPKIDAIAVTTGPGLEPALWVGINFAQALGAYWDIPVIPVNHMEGHIFSIFPNKGKKFTIDRDENMFPMLSLLVSGGHTEIVLVKDWMKYKLIGQTRDDAAGEAFDKVARMLGLPYPGGPEISKLAKEARERGISQQRNIRASHKAIANEVVLPRPMIHSKDYDFSFSGLKTAVLYYIRDNGPLTETMKSQIAKEFEDAAIEVLVSKTIRAVQQYKIKTLIIGGGVSANTYLQEQLTTKVKKETKGVHTYFPVKALSTDNALMIAIAGYFQYQKKAPKNKGKLKADGNLPL
jgi:N6-L-threonylcarbamoyladenine synthase